jgi:hypothetical protein
MPKYYTEIAVGEECPRKVIETVTREGCRDANCKRLNGRIGEIVFCSGGVDCG